MAEAETDSPAETSQRFFRYFQQEITTLQTEIETLRTTADTGGERLDATEHAQSAISALSHAVQDASAYIPAYDQRTYAQGIKGLQERLEKTRTPRQKFSFMSGRKGVGIGSEVRDQIETAQSSTTVTASPGLEAGKASGLQQQETGAGQELVDRRGAIWRPSLSGEKSIQIAGQRAGHIILSSPSSQVTTATLSNLEHCVVDISSPTIEKAFASVTLKHIRESLIICGRVDGSAHVTGLEDCVILVACRQFRMHECLRCDVYLQASGRPIVESVKEVRFAPLRTEASFKVENMWDQVDDFKWLKSEPSPNWSILPEDERISDRVWTQNASKEVSKSLDDILSTVGVGKGTQR